MIKSFAKNWLFIFFLTAVFLEKIAAQNGFGINLNRNFSYSKEGRKNVFSNTGVGLSYFIKDDKKKFINYELSGGIDLNNITIIDQLNFPPFLIDNNKIYTHSINNINIDATGSFKKKFNFKNNFCLDLGVGITPKVFIVSRAKVFYNDSLIAKGVGVRLMGFYDFFKVYDLFYCGIELKKKIDIRVNAEGVIIKHLGLNDMYYFKSENNINYDQISLQIILNI